MSLSTVNLMDADSVWKDESGRSLGFFCQTKPIRIDPDLIEELKKTSIRMGGKNLRLCLHEDQNADFHEMIILEQKGNYYRPHKHISKGESYHIIEGTQGVFIFDDEGVVIDTCILEPQGTLIYRVGPDMYHTVMPVTDFVIYHESKPGPFIRESDSIYPEWAPDGTDIDQIAAFVNELTSQMEL